MGIDEFVFGLLTIISGLAISHLVGGMHLLLFNRHAVRWHWLLPLAAYHIAWATVTSWWIMWRSFHGWEGPFTLIRFMLPLAQQICLFVAARGVLPEVITASDGKKIDLETYYFEVKKYVWGAMLVVCLLVLLATTIYYAPLNFEGSLYNYLYYSFAGCFYLTMAFVKNRAFHKAAVPFAVIFQLATTATLTINL
jgi:hypothetical protein